MLHTLLMVCEFLSGSIINGTILIPSNYRLLSKVDTNKHGRKVALQHNFSHVKGSVGVNPSLWS